VSRIHGRYGQVYIGSTGGGTAASPCAFVADWSINFTTQKVDVTALGDSNLTYVAGLPNAEGDFTGFFDTATAQTYLAAVDGLSRTFYLYPSTITAAPGEYFYGTILADFTVAGGVASAVTMKSSWAAAGPVLRYPPSGVPGS
jgi:hypothetical protein